MKLHAMIGFEFKKVFLNGKWAAPLVLLLAYLGITYTMAPAGVMNNLAIGAYVQFCVMLLMGFVINASNTDMIDAAILVKAGQKITVFYLAKLLNVAYYCLIGTIVSIGIPYLRFFISGTNFFLRAFTTSDVISAFFLHLLLGMTGGVIGLLLNKRIVPNRAFAIIIAILYAILCIVKKGLHTELLWTKYVTWLLPPIYDIVQAYGQLNYFSVSLYPVYLWMSLYLGVICVLYVVIMKHIKYK